MLFLTLNYARALLLVCAWLTALGPATVLASTAITELAATPEDGPVTLFYPSDTPARPVHHGQFAFELASDGHALAGNGRLVIISLGSGGSPWVGADLAELLVARGFVVAMPEHRGDNYRDDSDPGPDSWTRRPAEVSRAIDRVGADARFHDHLILDRVGIFGISAGGHTALELAGGTWSPARFMQHCELANHLRDDFPACVGLITALRHDMFDGLRLWLAERVIRHRFDDPSPRHARDPRIAVAVVAVPFAADFDMDGFRQLPVPVGFVVSSDDLWLAPRFHDLAVLAVCNTCSVIATLEPAGHGAMLSPHPGHFQGIEGALINDPPGFDRSKVAQVNAEVADFIASHLLP